MKPAAAREQLDAETHSGEKREEDGDGDTSGLHPIRDDDKGDDGEAAGLIEEKKLHRFHGTVQLNPTRVGRDAGRIAEEVVAHLASLVGAQVTVTLEIAADLPDGASEHTVRTVNENSRTLKFESHGFEES